MNPRFSVIIPVLNESANINDTISHVRNLAIASRLSTEIIVVDGDTEGKTIVVIKDKQVITIAGKAGRGSQMNIGAAMARGEILLFLHADTRLPDDGLLLIDAACGNPGRGAGAFDLAIDSKRTIFRLIEKTASLNVRSVTGG